VSVTSTNGTVNLNAVSTSGSCSWLTTSLSPAATPSTLTLTPNANAALLQSATTATTAYPCVITLTGSGGGLPTAPAVQAQVTATLTVNPQPIIGVNPTVPAGGLIFNYSVNGAQPASTILNISGSPAMYATGYNVSASTATTNCGSFLSAVPSTGSTPFTLTITATGTGTLPVGTCNGTVTLTGIAATPVTIPVHLLVTASKANIGVFRSGFFWVLDANGNGTFDGTGLGQDLAFGWSGFTAQTGDIPVYGDWNGDGKTKIGIYRPSSGQWFLDFNGNRLFDVNDKVYNYGGIAGDIPVVGDWTGTGTSKIGIFRAGFFWILDSNGNGTFDAGDANFAYGGVAGDKPVVGDWNGSGTTKVGIFRAGFLWVLDTNNSHAFDAGDTVTAYGGLSGDVPVVGDWNGNGTSKIGIFRAGFLWLLDVNGNGTFDQGTDIVTAFGGITGDVPVVGKWQ